MADLHYAAAIRWRSFVMSSEVETSLLVAQNKIVRDSPTPLEMTECRLRHFGHSLPIQINFADAFDPREHVVNRLAPHPYQFRAHDAGHEIARQLEHFLRRAAIEAFAQNRGHRAGERLHFRPQRHAKMRFALVVDLEINADGIRAFLVLAHIFENECFAGARLLLLRVVRIGNERFAPLDFRQRFEEINDFFELWRVHLRFRHPEPRMLSGSRDPVVSLFGIATGFLDFAPLRSE